MGGGGGAVDCLLAVECRLSQQWVFRAVLK